LGVPSSAIDDVVQDVFLTVHRRLPTFVGQCSVETWVFSILLRVVRNHRRTQRRKGAAFATSSAVGDPELLPGRDDPSDTVSLREAQKILHRLLSKLKQRHASIWIMASVEGLAPAEIAKKTGLGVFTVYSRLKAARHQLDRELDRLSLIEDTRLLRWGSPRSSPTPLTSLSTPASSAA
jgi:RNA polymerase sigma-70 factor (ECF subfamily)